MAIFKIYNTDFGFKRNGVDYAFEHVNEVQIESSVRNQITRGANASNKVGIAYRDGLREPDRWTVPVLNLTPELKQVLDEIFDNQERVDFYAIDRTNGSTKMARNALLSNRAQQLSMDETADSLAVSLEFVSFDSSEVHKA